MKKSKIVVTCIGLTMLALGSCKESNVKTAKKDQESDYIKQEREAIDSLKKYNLYNYLDSAYFYTYVYFGGAVIKRCGAVNIDSVLPIVTERKVVCQNLLLRKVRFMPDSFFVFLTITPLVKDSILSCDMVEGPQLPHEIMFNYKTKKFVQFVYDESSYLRLGTNPVTDYENGLKKLIEEEKLEPHKKFKELITNVMVK